MAVTSKLYSFGERLHQVAGGGTYQDVAERLGLEYETARKYILNERFPAPETLRKIAQATRCSLHWLITGEGSREIRSTDSEIIDKLSAQELKAAKNLADQEQRDMPTTIYLLAQESLASRNLIPTSLSALDESLFFSLPEQFARNERVEIPLVEISFAGEIMADGDFIAAPDGSTIQVPHHYPLPEHFLFCYRARSEDLFREGLGKDLLIICTKGLSVPEGQPVVIMLEGKDKTPKALVRRYYRDPIVSKQVIFRSIKDSAPPIWLRKGFKVEGVVLGVEPWSMARTGSK
jgi:transcriptional regulator with XRE-family HTH domain